MPLSESELLEHLEDMGWEAKRRPKQTLKAMRPTSQGDMPVYIRLTEDWLIASVVPFLSTGGRNSFELTRWLLRQNRDMVQAKFAIDEDGDVVLSVEVPTESIDPGEIERALEDLVRYAGEHLGTLRMAAS